ncbi:relaxase domain-containing protein [Vibrio parahaemolyticus]|nr:relaxase domain-containing protein [Vibrio parahaemolyticus]
MLTIFPIRNVDYYVEWTQNDYYLNNDEQPGIWIGYIAHLLGLNGEIIEEHYKNLMKGFSPDGKTAYVQNAGKNRNLGYDLTFSAPKSVSILEVFDEVGCIQNAHERAVRAALRFVEEKAAYTRRSSKGQTLEKLPGLLAAQFTHFKSRANDIQLHTHCLILNLAIRNDLSWGTINGRNLYQWMKAAGSVYRAELARNLRHLGYSIESDGDSFKVTGIPAHICQYYSKRSQQIDESLKIFNERSSASPIGDHIKLYTRKKDKKPLCKEDYLRWQTELATLGFTRDQAKSIRMSFPTDAKSYIDTELALDQLTEKKSVIREQDLYYHLGVKAQLSGDSAENLASLAMSALTSEQVVLLGQDKQGYILFSTRKIIELEKNMVFLARKASQHFHRAPNKLLLHKLINSRSEFYFSEEQAFAINEACSSKKLSILQGSAGAGKSASMKVVRQAYESSGQKVYGACIAKVAADNLYNETGINSGTIAKLINDSKNGRAPLNDTDVLIIDEAGQVGTKQMNSLLTIAETYNTKLILVGEDKQLDAIEHGGVLSYLSRPDIIGTSRIENIKRQKEEWAREVVMNLRDGKSFKALQELDRRNLVNICSSKDDAIKKLIKQWKKLVLSDKDTVVLAQKWDDVSTISAEIRKHYKATGTLKNDVIKITCSVSGKQMSLPFAEGEQVRFTKNNYQLNVSNGTFGTIESIKISGDRCVFHIRLKEGRSVSFDTAQHRDDSGNLTLIHAYAMTVYSSQGITVNGDTLILYNSGMGRESTYVSGSRHRNNCYFFLNVMDIEDALITKESSRDFQLKMFSSFMNQERKSMLAISHLDLKPTEIHSKHIERQ